MIRLLPVLLALAGLPLLAKPGPLPDLPGLRLVRVGTAKLTSTLLFGNILTRESSSADLSRLGKKSEE